MLKTWQEQETVSGLASICSTIQPLLTSTPMVNTSLPMSNLFPLDVLTDSQILPLGCHVIWSLNP